MYQPLIERLEEVKNKVKNSRLTSMYNKEMEEENGKTVAQLVAAGHIHSKEWFEFKINLLIEQMQEEMDEEKEIYTVFERNVIAFELEFEKAEMEEEIRYLTVDIVIFIDMAKNLLSLMLILNKDEQILSQLDEKLNELEEKISSLKNMNQDNMIEVKKTIAEIHAIFEEVKVLVEEIRSKFVAA